MFKLQISLDHHNARLKFNYCLRFDPCHFSLPSTFKANGFLGQQAEVGKRAGEALKATVFLGQQAEMEMAKNENP
jgi:hypothetical protein